VCRSGELMPFLRAVFYRHWDLKNRPRRSRRQGPRFVKWFWTSVRVKFKQHQRRRACILHCLCQAFPKDFLRGRHLRHLKSGVPNLSMCLGLLKLGYKPIGCDWIPETFLTFQGQQENAHGHGAKTNSDLSKCVILASMRLTGMSHFS